MEGQTANRKAVLGPIISPDIELLNEGFKEGETSESATRRQGQIRNRRLNPGAVKKR
jgi:hypothetical protein